LAAGLEQVRDDHEREDRDDDAEDAVRRQRAGEPPLEVFLCEEPERAHCRLLPNMAARNDSAIRRATHAAIISGQRSVGAWPDALVWNTSGTRSGLTGSTRIPGNCS